jgi:hypothetical protein
MTERDVMLNQLAQELRPMSQGIEWLTHSALLLRRLRSLVAQAVRH